MGYRSEIYMVIEAHDNLPEDQDDKVSPYPLGLAADQFFKFKAMADAAGLTPEAKEWVWGGDGNKLPYGYSDTSFVLSVSDIKWYPSYPEIDKMEKFFALACDMNEDGTAYLSGMFMRVGEDAGDVEEKFFGDDVPDGIYARTILEVDGRWKEDEEIIGKPYVAPHATQTEEV